MHPLTRLIYDSLTPENYTFDVFFDIGANTGQTCALASKTFPEARILSFEPVASPYRELVKAAASIPNAETYNLAFGEKSGPIELFHKELTVHNTLLPSRNKPLDRAGRTSEIVQVSRYQS